MGFQVVVYLCLVILVFATRGLVATAADEECRVTRCSKYGPDIRFPFWLKHKQPEYCGYPGFQLTCHKGRTMLQLQYIANTSLDGIQLHYSGEIPVYRINYTSQEIEYDSYGFTSSMKMVLTPTSSSLSAVDPPLFYSISDTITFFSCPSGIGFRNWNAEGPVMLLTSLSGQPSEVYVFNQYTDTGEASITSCIKVFSSSFPYLFKWFTPNCSKCEAKGEYCKLTKNSTTSNIETADHSTKCFSIPRQQSTRGGHRSIKPIAGIVPGGILIVLVLVALLYYMIRSYRQKKYDQLKIEMFLADYKAMKPTRYTYGDIKKITSHFSDKLGEGGYGSVYKGQITDELIVAVKVLNSDPKANGEDFINEVGTIGRIHHVNVVRLVGYCADGCNRALVYEFQPNNSLEKFTYSSKNHRNNFLGWEKMQEIALGICKGIEYLHQGCAQQILHFDIKPHNILLDQNFNPKISDFGLAKLCSKDQSVVSMTMARGTIGYIAPEVYSRNFGKVSSKSDVYSFGMLLLEMVGARDNNAAEDTSETYFPERIFHRLEEGGEVTIQIEKEEDSNIAKKLTIVGLWCIGWHPVDRPSMKHVIQMLERQDCPAMPPNPFRSSNVRPFTTDLEVISESE